MRETKKYAMMPDSLSFKIENTSDIQRKKIIATGKDFEFRDFAYFNVCHSKSLTEVKDALYLSYEFYLRENTDFVDIITM